MSELFKKLYLKNSSDLIKDHCLEGYAYYFSPQNYDFFEKKWLTTIIENEIRINELDKLLKKCQRSNISLCLLKGMYFIQNIYENSGQRSMCDVDLYIAKNDLLPLSEIFYDLGYREIKSKKWNANNFKTVFEKEIEGFKLPFEIHTKLTYLEPAGFRWQVHRNGKSDLLEMDPTEQLIYLCIHAAHQHTYIFYHWLIDIELYLKNKTSKIDWSRLFEISKQLRSCRSVAATLYIMTEYAQLTLPKEVQQFINKAGISRLKGQLTIDFLLYPHANRLKYFLIKNLLKENLTQALSYNTNWLKAKLYETMDE